MRRRPVQSRAYASSQALQEAFVRVLIEEGFEKTTVREVTAVAGVGIGTFYDYFGNMDALAALCIHRRMKALALAARSVAAEQADTRRSTESIFCRKTLPSRLRPQSPG